MKLIVHCVLIKIYFERLINDVSTILIVKTLIDLKLYIHVYCIFNGGKIDRRGDVNLYTQPYIIKTEPVH